MIVRPVNRPELRGHPQPGGTLDHHHRARRATLRERDERRLATVEVVETLAERVDQ